MKDREEIVSAFKQCGLPGACLKCQYGTEREWCYAALKHDVIELLKEQPKIVRCKDCKHGTLFQNAHGEWMVECENPDALWLERLITTPDWFCADGEAKQDG